MDRRNFFTSVGIASGMLLGGTTPGRGVRSDLSRGDDTEESSNRINTADDLVELSTVELLELDNEAVRRPFDPAVGGGAAYNADEFAGASGYPHGGTFTRSDGDYVVSTADQLEDATDAAEPDATIWVEGDAAIDMTGLSCTLASGVTIASDRGRDGSEGALLYQDHNEFNTFLKTGGDDIRITGIRFSGPEHEYWDLEERDISSIYDVGITWALTIDDDDRIEIDNCRFSGFTYTGIRVGMWGDYRCDGIYVHHCEFVNNPSPSLGYGVNVYGGDPLLEYNYFDNNRRSVVGVGGDLPVNYVVRNNLFGPRTRLAPIDVHGGTVNDMDEPQAGVRMIIDNNVVLSEEGIRSGSPQPAVVIRGVPRERAYVRRNWFFTSRAPPFSADEGTGDGGGAIRQWTDRYTAITAFNNITGKLDPAADIGLAGTAWDPRRDRSRQSNGE
jgi:hypothetical protein